MGILLRLFDADVEALHWMFAWLCLVWQGWARLGLAGLGWAVLSLVELG